uniref:Ubiquitin-like protease family profile domain-containing protein n=1 Tax=Plectus sambesii TaxID=2011161 RepID=A0A914VN85_9BILA
MVQADDAGRVQPYLKLIPGLEEKLEAWSLEWREAIRVLADKHLAALKQRTTLAHPSQTKFLSWLQEIHSRLQTRMVQLQAGAKPRPKDQRYVRLDERIANAKLLNCPDMGSQMLAAERYLTRSAYMVHDVDSAGVSRKAARVVSKKYIRLDAERKLAPNLPKRRRPFRARKPVVQPSTQPPPIQSPPMQPTERSSPPVQSPPIQPLTQPTERSPLMQLQPTEASWLEQSPPTRAQPTEQSLPWVATNLTAADFASLRGKAWLNDMIIDSYLVLVNARSQLVSRQRVYAFLTHFYTMMCSRGYTSVRTWTKVDDILDHDLLLFPINDRGNHWTLIVVNMPRWRISYYDSMGSNGDRHLQTIRRAVCSSSATIRPPVPLSARSPVRSPARSSVHPPARSSIRPPAHRQPSMDYDPLS